MPHDAPRNQSIEYASQHGPLITLHVVDKKKIPMSTVSSVDGASTPSTAQDGSLDKSIDNRDKDKTTYGKSTLKHPGWQPSYLTRTSLRSWLGHVATLYNMLDFEIGCIMPYSILKRGRPVNLALFTNTLGKTSIGMLWLGLRHVQLSVTASAFSVILAPLLTIVVSGLFTVEKIPTSTPGVVLQQDWLSNSNAINATTESQNIAEVISLYNVTYPQWTYGGMILPQVSADVNISLLNRPESTSTQYSTTALMPNMNCSLAPPPSKASSIYAPGGLGTPATISITFWPPSEANCPVSGELFTNITLQYDVTADLVSTWFGQVYSNLLNMSCGSKQLLAFGKFNDDQQLDQVHLVACDPYIEQVKANVTLSLPELAVDITNPPYVSERGGKIFSTYQNVPSTFPLLSLAPQASYFDGFFDYVLYGRNATNDLDGLLSEPSSFVAAAETTYGTYVAQIVNSGGFRTNTPADMNTTVEATNSNTQRMRLIQHFLPTRLLEGILGLLFLCAVVIYTDIWRYTNGTRRFLPKSPYTIASLASLLAGSDLLKSIPPGTEFLSDGEMEKRGIFKGLQINLGWWENRQWFGIDIGKAEG